MDTMLSIEEPENAFFLLRNESKILFLKSTQTSFSFLKGLNYRNLKWP